MTLARTLLCLLTLSACDASVSSVSTVAAGYGVMAAGQASHNDKMGHFGAGIAANGIVRSAGGSRRDACVAAVVVGVGKEALDSMTGGHVEAQDVAATAAGGCLGWVWEF